MTRIASDIGGGGGSCSSSKSEKALHALNGRSNNVSRASPFSLLNSSSNRYVKRSADGARARGHAELFPYLQLIGNSLE